ncbi:3-hydroxyacyl-CoA dehydrogenase NAD-binding domain-containing protein [Amycolatopsis nivea]|uniref:3-hydroxyacyl-CoA dehydrogenase NAD-binding domain-containing protein n=1 Tax=Amycolatopsis nivea TaxID=1644109 RepID=UPI0014305C28|nr:3-hydroxyacyl-CoA dehydrogenase NAD-binding domain-containing protein [Amycolatopsis nivea]
MTERIRRGVVFIEFSSPPVNALSLPLRAEIYRAVSKHADEHSARAIVLTGARGTFCGGADIREFDSGGNLESPTLREIISLIESSPVPVIAAISGVALGGGLELAAACHARVSREDAQLGQPEVVLGMVPGAGATQRLPRLMGVGSALELITTGRSVSGADAAASGLVQAVIGEDMVNDTLEFLDHARPEQLLLARDRRIASTEEEDRAALERLAAKVPDCLRPGSPEALCAEAVMNVHSLGMDDGLARERELFEVSRASRAAAARRHLFFAERIARRTPRGAKARHITHIAVVGLGAMGRHIAVAAARAGCKVSGYDVSREVTSDARRWSAAFAERQLQAGKVTADEAGRIATGITWESDFDSGAAADLVVEAVVEQPAVKVKVLKEVSGAVGRETLIATNTSGIDLDYLASGTVDASRFLAMHFFNPATHMRLVEIGRAKETSDDTVATAADVATRMSKVPVVVGAHDGLAANYTFRAYLRQAENLVLRGASCGEVDEALREFGFAMGPFAVADLAGIDVGWHGRNESARVNDIRPWAPVSDALYEAGRLGRKARAGWYDYPAGEPPQESAETINVLQQVRKRHEVPAQTFADNEIVDACMFAIMNATGRLLEAQVITDSAAMDVIWTNGYGLSRDAGGPVFQAERGLFARWRAKCDVLLAWDEVNDPALSPWLSDALGA